MRLIIESEKSLDKEFKKMGVRLYVYHISARSIASILFGGVTIVSNKPHHKHVLIDMVYGIDSDCINTIMPATHMIEALTALGFAGVAVCDRRDKYNRPHGRRDAKRRLISYLKHPERINNE